ncbi:substrate-binding domain-containing protein [Paenibacillus thiaminolyticus]|uniref:LacI family DNA-binding transcriptional regulator n=1 Tax=Paenibacillus thiaminolyticus TaxID=49283 RepID=UPI00232FC2B4|nr:substrate-binding domain-containing protein [Paenibacillus thiaminolyticus]WCF09399.1 substrate-binding domain-containing protein [Paenibacillus thiaminolyticus]
MDRFAKPPSAGGAPSTTPPLIGGAANMHPEAPGNVRRAGGEYQEQLIGDARKHSSRNSGTIGLFIVQDHNRIYEDDLFYGAIVGAIISQCGERGYRTLVTILDVSDATPLLGLYEQKSIDAGLLISWSDVQGIVDQVSRAGFVIGVLNQNNISQSATVLPAPYLDNRKSAYEATRYLLELGHRDVAIITGPTGQPCSSERLAGFLDAALGQGVEVPDSRIWCGDFTEQAGAAAAMQWLEADDLPAAVFCSNDLMAYGLLKVLRQQQVAVPERLSVVGFDDLIISRYTCPPLTTMSIPRTEMAAYVTNRLIHQLENPEEAYPLPVFRAQLMVRESCRAVRVPDFV